MRAQCSVFIATSLDGFIARPDGNIDWLMQANALVPEGEDCGYAAFMKTVDAVVMGRKTFEHVLTFDPWPFHDRKVEVMTSRPMELPPGLAAGVSVCSQSPAALVQRLTLEGNRRLYVDGGKTIQGFLAAGLVDDITITMVPVLLGAGRPLFGPLAHDVHLTLVSSRAYDFGFVQNTYAVRREHDQHAP